MSLDDACEVPDPKSERSTSATLRPAWAASSATRLPMIPAPTTSRSNSPSKSRTRENHLNSPRGDSETARMLSDESGSCPPISVRASRAGLRRRLEVRPSPVGGSPCAEAAGPPARPQHRSGSPDSPRPDSPAGTVPAPRPQPPATPANSSGLASYPHSVYSLGRSHNI
jgi:hypothetical protein